MTIKENLKTLTGKAKEFAGRYFERFFCVLKKNRLLLILILELFLAPVIVYFLLKTSEFNFLLLLVIYILWLITFYVFFQKAGSNWLKIHKEVLTVLAIIIPIFLFFLQNSIQIIQLRDKYEVSLKEENNRNNSHLESIINDLSNDPNTVFWRDFSLRSYVEFWDYIHLNKTQDCKNLYARLTIQLGILNNINKMRQELVFTPNSLYKEMLGAASSTKPILDKIIGNCQLF